VLQIKASYSPNPHSRLNTANTSPRVLQKPLLQLRHKQKHDLITNLTSEFVELCTSALSHYK